MLYNTPGRDFLIFFRKSQIAIEYSYRVRCRTPEKWVFWVHASSAARVEQAYREIATKVNLPGCDDPKVNILRLVLNWLSDEQNGTWLMILDNADDSDVFFDQTTSNPVYRGNLVYSDPRLINFVPPAPHGTVLVTSRNRTAAYALVGDYENIIKVDPLDEGKSLDLMKAKLSVGAMMEEDAKNLLKVLEYILRTSSTRRTELRRTRRATSTSPTAATAAFRCSIPISIPYESFRPSARRGASARRRRRINTCSAATATARSTKWI